MTNKEKDIYSKLYDITQDNLVKATGKTMPTFKETFMAAVDLDSSQVDLSPAYDMPTDKYMQVLYYLTYQRWVGQDEEEKYKVENYSSEDEYKGAILKDVFESTERVITKSVVKNYIDYSDSDIKSVGKLKRSIRRFLTKIKAAIPLKYKMAVKKAFLKVIK